MNNSLYVKKSHLLVRPTPASIRHTIIPYLRQVPYQTGGVTEENIHVTIFRSTSPMFTDDLRPNIYKAKITGCEQWVNPISKTRNIILTLESKSLEARHKELSNVYADIFPTYSPHMTLVYDIAQNAAKYRWWFNDLANVFNEGGRYHGLELELAGEELQDTILFTPHKLRKPTLPIDKNLAIVPETGLEGL